ncbi:MAG TPA: asparaginase domain-containing protein [Quisquiliibacterium sp.]|nr:asparaginase domain-containing protein [Quisquiliibacterium sp.]
MSLRILATGGTFDKRYDPIPGTLGFGRTHLHEIVLQARIGGVAIVQELMQLDSLDMSDAHRLQVLDACAASPEQRIVVVHGTDTMVETARVLGEAGLGKTVVLTGAMIPLDLAGSDALFNLGFAAGCALALDAGVYLAMNGQAFAWDSVRKNKKLGVFEAVPR